jgi:nucleoid DNA-binding protein
MQALITSYLIQKKECNLPLLGHFRIKTKPADFEKANKKIFPPTDEILYSEFAGKLSADLITYVSDVRNITTGEAELKINNWCQHSKEKLDLGEKIIFNSIGSLQKDAAGNIFFQRKRGFSFYEPVSAATDKNLDYRVTTGDAPVVLNEFAGEEINQKRAWWKIWSIALVAVSLLVLVYYFYTSGFSEAGFGNQASVPIADPPELHNAP